MSTPKNGDLLMMASTAGSELKLHFSNSSIVFFEQQQLRDQFFVAKIDCRGVDDLTQRLGDAARSPTHADASSLVGHRCVWSTQIGHLKANFAVQIGNCKTADLMLPPCRWLLDLRLAAGHI